MNRLLNGVWLYRDHWNDDGFSLHAVMPDGRVTGWTLVSESGLPYVMSYVSQDVKTGLKGVCSNNADWSLTSHPYTYKFPITLISRELDDEASE